MLEDNNVIVTKLLDKPSPTLVEVESSLMDEFCKNKGKNNHFQVDEQAYFTQKKALEEQTCGKNIQFVW